MIKSEIPGQTREETTAQTKTLWDCRGSGILSQVLHHPHRARNYINQDKRAEKIRRSLVRCSSKKIRSAQSGWTIQFTGQRTQIRKKFVRDRVKQKKDMELLDIN